MILAWIGTLTIMAGALALYLASPQQAMTRSAMPRRPLMWSGSIGLLIGIGVLLSWAGPATAVFKLVTFAMLVWTLIPLACAWARHRRADKR